MSRGAQLLTATGVSVLVTSGCASHAQTAPVYRETAAPGSTDTAVREEFDPARFRQDLLLIEPVFTPPGAITGADAAAPTAVPAPIEQPVIVADATPVPPTSATTVPVFRVQVIALSKESGARSIADELRRRYDVPTDVVAQGQLFTVRAGELRTADAAEALRSSIAALSQGYAGAFLINDTLRSTTDTTIVDAPVAVVDAGTLTPEPVVADSAGSPIVDDTPPAPQPEPELVLVQGWRVLIGDFQNLTDAQQYRSQVMRRLKRDDVDVKFEAPRYKVLAGSFRASTEAQQFVERCRSLGFRTAALVRGDVYLPREQEGNR